MTGGYTGAERRRRRAACEAHAAVHGLWCPGWGVESHAVSRFSQLSADHLWPLAYGGPQNGPLQVLCGACNTRRRYMPRRPAK